jgi:hypothetical protein
MRGNYQGEVVANIYENILSGGVDILPCAGAQQNIA